MTGSLYAGSHSHRIPFPLAVGRFLLLLRAFKLTFKLRFKLTFKLTFKLAFKLTFKRMVERRVSLAD